MLAQGDAGHGEERAIVAVGGLVRKQLLRLLVGPLVAVALTQRLGVFKAGGSIVGGYVEYALQQQFGIVHIGIATPFGVCLHQGFAPEDLWRPPRARHS